MKIKLPALALAALLFAGLPLASSSAYVAVSVGIAPPAIPIYQQPLCPAPGYIWTPGYWSYADFGYYWVPGVWVAPPRLGFLWTPSYWGYRGGRYYFNDGYWGPTVGFYGGINYGYGYGGRGYYGGEWVGNTFRYNTAVTRVNTTVIHNTYVNKTVVKNNTGSRAGFNGPGGAKAKPSSQEQAAAKAEHVAATSTQRSRNEAAKADPALHAKNNKGKPKAEAVNALERKNEQPAAGRTEGTGKQAGAEKPGGADKQTRAERRAGGEQQQTATARKATGEETSDRVRKANDRPSRTAKAEQGSESNAPRVKKASQEGRNVETRKAASTRRPEQLSQSAQRRPQGALKPREAGPGRENEQAPQDAKKKKKKKRPNEG